MAKSYRVTIRYATEPTARCYVSLNAGSETEAIQRVWNRHMRPSGCRHAYVALDEEISPGLHIVQMGWHAGINSTRLDGKVVVHVEPLT